MKVTVKETVMLSFDLTANANSIRILLMFNGLWAKRSIQRTSVKRGLTPKKVEGTMFCNRILVIGF